MRINHRFFRIRIPTVQDTGTKKLQIRLDPDPTCTGYRHELDTDSAGYVYRMNFFTSPTIFFIALCFIFSGCLVILLKSKKALLSRYQHSFLSWNASMQNAAVLLLGIFFSSLLLLRMVIFKYSDLLSLVREDELNLTFRYPFSLTFQIM
jgi:hypothetical protein